MAILPCSLQKHSGKVEPVQFAMSELIQDTSIENWISYKTKTTQSIYEQLHKCLV